MSQLTSFLLMNKFITEKKYDLVIEIFEKYLLNLNERSKDELRPTNFELKKQNQLIPFGHLRLAVESLLYMVLKSIKNCFQ